MVRKRRTTTICVFIGAALIIAACASFSATGAGKNRISAERVDEIAGKLVLISIKAENKLRRSEPVPTEQDLERVLRSNNQALFNSLNDVILKFQIQERHVIVLACDKTQSFMIVEDSSCTFAIDRKDSTEKYPCIFTLEAKQVCIYK